MIKITCTKKEQEDILKMLLWNCDCEDCIFENECPDLPYNKCTDVFLNKMEWEIF